MTKKETLYKEYISITNKVCDVMGITKWEREDEEYFSSDEFKRKASVKTVKEWESKIATEQKTYQYEIKKKKLSDFFNTENGKALKEKTLAQIEEINRQMNEASVTTTSEIDNVVKEFLGTDWGCSDVWNGTHVEIGILDTDGKKIKFGMSFEITIRENAGKYKTEMCYGSMGHFDLLNDTFKMKYLLGMAKFASNQEAINKVQTILSKSSEKMMELSKKNNKLSSILDNPFEEKIEE